MAHALPLLLVVAASAYDSCHVTPVIRARYHRRHRGRHHHWQVRQLSLLTAVTWHRGDLEGVGGMLQKLDAFYCIFERFRAFQTIFSLYTALFDISLSCLTQLIVLTISSPFTEVKHLRARLVLGWLPLRLKGFSLSFLRTRIQVLLKPVITFCKCLRWRLGD